MSIIHTEAVERRPQVPLQIITPNDVRASIRRAKASLEKAAEEIVWQIEREAWRTLGYTSWNAMREAEYGGAAFMVPAKSRPELVQRIRAKGLTQREAAQTVGVTEQTIYNDERRARDPKYLGRTADSEDTDDDVIDAEIVEDSEEPVRFDRETGEVLATPDATTDPVPAESAVITVACPTCHGTGKVTR